MSLARALVAVAALAAAAPPALARPPSAPADAPDTVDTTTVTSSTTEEIRYPEGSTGPERPGWGTGSGRIFSQLVAPLVQLVVNQLLQATNLVGALAGAAGGRSGPGAARPDAVLQFFSAALGASSGGSPFPAKARAPANL